MWSTSRQESDTRSLTADGSALSRGAKVRYIDLVRNNRNFRYLWFSEIISFLGDWFNTIALYAIVDELSGSGRAVAGILVGKTLPVFLVAPLAGPLVDRLDRRLLMIVSDVSRAALALGLIAAHRFESLPGIYLCHVAMVGMAGVFIPARFAAFPQVTRPEELGAANALSGGTWSAMLAVGAALGGWATAAFGVDASLALDSLTFLASAAFLLLLPRLPAPGAEESHHDRSFLGGLRHVVREKETLALASLKPGIALAGGALLLIPVLGNGHFPARSGPLWVGALFAARGLGALCGSMFVMRLFGDTSRVLRRTILVMFPLAGLAYGGLSRAETIEAAAFSFFVAAIAIGAIWVMSGTLLQRQADPRYLGRILSVEFGTMTLVISAVSWAAGWILDVTGARPEHVAAASGALLFVPFLGWGAFLVARRAGRETREGGGAPVAPPTGAAPDAFEISPPPEEEGVPPPER